MGDLGLAAGCLLGVLVVMAKSIESREPVAVRIRGSRAQEIAGWAAVAVCFGLVAVILGAWGWG